MSGKTLTNEQKDLIRAIVPNDVSHTDFELFLEVCARTGLDPLARQIYLLPKQDIDGGRRHFPLTSIDGLRLIADRACRDLGWVRGNLPTQWTYDGQTWLDAWVSDKHPLAARYTIRLLTPQGEMNLSAVASFRSYHQTKRGGQLTHSWHRMSDVLLAKCAEALALRQCFPQELSGLYTNDEIPDNETERPQHREQKESATSDISTIEHEGIPPSIKKPYLSRLRDATIKETFTEHGGPTSHKKNNIEMFAELPEKIRTFVQAKFPNSSEGFAWLDANKWDVDSIYVEIENYNQTKTE